MAKTKEVFRLNRSERKKIEKRRDEEPDKRVFRRLSALLGLDDGCSQEEVTRFLGTTARTIGRWIKTYRKSGLEVCVYSPTKDESVRWSTSNWKHSGNKSRREPFVPLSRRVIGYRTTMV